MIRLRPILFAVGAAFFLHGTAQAQQVARAPLGGGSGVDVSPIRIILSLVICIAVAVLAILLIRQRNGTIDLRALMSRAERRASRITVHETRRLGMHADACLVECDGREYLLVLQQGGVHVLRDHAPGEAADQRCA